jgi:hypothetical protein
VAKRKTPEWRGVQDWTDALPLWRPGHPLQRFVGRTVYPKVELAGSASITVAVPALDDVPLQEIIASFAVAEIAEWLPRVATIAALEPIACLYDYEWDSRRGCWLNPEEPGTGTPEKMQAIYDRLGIKTHGLVTSIFQPLVKLVCGNSPDASGYVSKCAGALSYWASFPADKRHSPIRYDEVAGSSDFADWMFSPQIHGYTGAAEKWRHRGEEESSPATVKVRSQTGRDEEPEIGLTATEYLKKRVAELESAKAMLVDEALAAKKEQERLTEQIDTLEKTLEHERSYFWRAFVDGEHNVDVVAAEIAQSDPELARRLADTILKHLETPKDPPFDDTNVVQLKR